MPMTLITMSGEVELRVPYGQDRESLDWFSPVRLAWGMKPHQRATPELVARLCLTAAATFSYEGAAQVVACWRGPLADDSSIHRHVQEAGSRAKESEERRTRALGTPARRAELSRRGALRCGPGAFSMVIMMDGFMSRDRGEDWGLKPAEQKGNRVSWREMKTAIVFRIEDRGETSSGRPVISDKGVVAHQGEWDGLAAKVQAEALRRGLEQAREVFVVADGGVWIWKLSAERFPRATETLDFYHATQHLWAVANELHGEKTPEARKWVEPLLHQLAHGGEAGVLATLQELGELLGPEQQHAAETLRRETAYFAEHSGRMHYEEVAKRGCPKGSGAMESTCAQLQGRIKRTGQFWTENGKENLLQLELARRNGDWPELWQQPVVQT